MWRLLSVKRFLEETTSFEDAEKLQSQASFGGFRVGDRLSP